MSHTITLYVDGACRGNPGLGGWGAYIINGQQEHKICGGEDHTTNNRMELTAAIEGILFCDKQDKLVIYAGKRKTGKTSKTLTCGKNWMQSVRDERLSGTGSRVTPGMPAMKWPISWPIRAPMKP